jgi:hypothetical protein
MIDLKFDPALSDETPVELNQNQKSTALNEIMQSIHALKYLHELIAKNQLTVATRVATMGCSESYLQSVSEALGYNGDLAKQKEERHSQLKAANTEIRRLEALVGSSKPMDGLPELLSNLTKTFKDYWQEELGLGSVYDSPLDDDDKHGGIGAGWGRAYYDAVLHCSFDVLGRSSIRYSKTPESDKEEQKEWFEQMNKQLDLHIEDNDYAQLKDTPRNRKWIAKKLIKRFPSLEITGWTIKQGWKAPEGTYIIRSLRIRINNLDDLKQ